MSDSGAAHFRMGEAYSKTRLFLPPAASAGLALLWMSCG